MPADPETLQPALISLAVGLLLGWLFATLLRRQDHRTFVLARAPALPIRSLAAHDDAWLRGTVHCARPLVCPWFDVDCVAYRYEIEKQVTTTRTDKDGKVHTETHWQTEHSEDETVDFDLDDGDRVHIALTEGDNQAMEGVGHDYETGTRRHSAQVLPLGATVSVLGVLRDDRTFGPLSQVPLLVTRSSRADAVCGAHSSEGWLFVFAVLLPWAGAAVAAGLWLQAETWPQWLQAAGIGLLAALPQWGLLTWNRLLRLRQQVRASQQQVAIELAQRANLVPNLVAVVRAAATHEQDLLAGLTAIRSGADFAAGVRGEGAAVQTSRLVLALHERYPQLRADAVYRDLHQRLWTIEEKLAHARTAYNDIVTEWNDRLQTFPSSLVASLARHRAAPLFAVEADEELPPRLTL